MDHNTNAYSQMSKTSQTLSNNQIRKASSTSVHTSTTITTNLSQVSHLSQPTVKAINLFFYDEPDSLYNPPSSHELEESPCKAIIRMDNHSLFYCTLHPDFRSYYLELIEHHIKYKDPEIHRSEILKLIQSI